MKNIFINVENVYMKMYSSTIFNFRPHLMKSIVYHKQELHILLYILGQIVT